MDKVILFYSQFTASSSPHHPSVSSYDDINILYFF